MDDPGFEIHPAEEGTPVSRLALDETILRHAFACLDYATLAKVALVCFEEVLEGFEMSNVCILQTCRMWARVMKSGEAWSERDRLCTCPGSLRSLIPKLRGDGTVGDAARVGKLARGALPPRQWRLSSRERLRLHFDEVSGWREDHLWTVDMRAPQKGPGVAAGDASGVFAASSRVLCVQSLRGEALLPRIVALLLGAEGSTALVSAGAGASLCLSVTDKPGLLSACLMLPPRAARVLALESSARAVSLGKSVSAAAVSSHHVAYFVPEGHNKGMHVTRLGDIHPSHTFSIGAPTSHYERLVPSVTVRAHEGIVTAVTLVQSSSPFAPPIGASASFDHTVAVWHADTGQLLAKLGRHVGRPWSLHLADRRADTIASDLWREQLGLWSTATPTITSHSTENPSLTTENPPKPPIEIDTEDHAFVHPDPQGKSILQRLHLVTGDTTGAIVSWDCATAKPIWATQHFADTQCIAEYLCQKIYEKQEFLLAVHVDTVAGWVIAGSYNGAAVDVLRLSDGQWLRSLRPSGIGRCLGLSVDDSVGLVAAVVADDPTGTVRCELVNICGPLAGTNLANIDLALAKESPLGSAILAGLPDARPTSAAIWSARSPLSANISLGAGTLTVGVVAPGVGPRIAACHGGRVAKLAVRRCKVPEDVESARDVCTLC